MREKMRKIARNEFVMCSDDRFANGEGLWGCKSERDAMDGSRRD